MTVHNRKAGYELLEIDQDGHSTRVGFYWDLQRASNEVIVFDSLPTVVVEVDSCTPPDERIVLDNGQFDFAERAFVLGSSGTTSEQLEPGSLQGSTVAEVKWLFAEWWHTCTRPR